MLNKKSDFKPCVINFKISVTELATILLAYIPPGLRALLVVPFSCVMSMTSLQRNTIKL